MEQSRSEYKQIEYIFQLKPFEKAIPRQVENPVMARISSKLPAAISNVGIPLKHNIVRRTSQNIKGSSHIS